MGISRSKMKKKNKTKHTNSNKMNVLHTLQSRHMFVSRKSSSVHGSGADYDSAVANTQIPAELQKVDLLSRSAGDNKTNYSIMGIIPLSQLRTGVLDH